MKLIDTVILAMALMAVSAAAAAAPALATRPEFEFAGSKTFSTEGGASTFETTKGEAITCEKTSGTGELEGTNGSGRIRDLLPVYTGCTLTVLKTYECQSAGAAKKEIRAFALSARLGYIDKAEHKVGILLSSEAEEGKGAIAEFECTRTGEAIKVKVKGSIIGLLTPVAKLVDPSEAFTLAFSKASGAGEVAKADRQFEGEAENQLLIATSLSKEEFIGGAIEGSIKIAPPVSATIVDTGAAPVFEFPAAKTVKIEGGAGRFETSSGEEVKCTSESGSGELEGESGSQKVTDVLVAFKGCTSTILTKTYKCKSAGAAEEEVKTADLSGRLGYIEKASPKVGLLLSPTAGGNFAELECTHSSEKVTVLVRGSIIGLITPVNTVVEPGGSTEYFLLDFGKGSGKGVPLYKSFEGESENLLETETTINKHFEQSAIEGSVRIYPSVAAKIVA